MENLQEKIEKACEKIAGFNKWLEEVRGSKEVIAMDYDIYDRVGGVILQQQGVNPRLPIPKWSREVEIYVLKDRRIPIENTWEWPCDTQKEIYKFLESVEMPSIILGGGLHVTTDSGPNSVPFVLVGKDSQGNIQTAKFRYQEYLAPRDQ
jgi:hypothetical protein